MKKGLFEGVFYQLLEGFPEKNQSTYKNSSYLKNKANNKKMPKKNQKTSSKTRLEKAEKISEQIENVKDEIIKNLTNQKSDNKKFKIKKNELKKAIIYSEILSKPKSIR